jgi:hypothetical protein
MPSTFVGEITIVSVRARDETGVLSGPATSGVDSTKDQIVSGTTTLFSADINVSIYDENKLPVFFRLMHLSGTTPPDTTRISEPDTPAKLDSTTVSGDDAGISATTTWSVVVPKNTLEKSKGYVIIAQDADGLATTCLTITTAA